MKFEKLQPGMVVYDVGRQKMGNTTMTTVAVWSVTIVSVDAETRSVMASWNGNRPSRYYEGSCKKWRETRPLLVRSGFGAYRLATKEEIASAREAQKNKEPTP